METITTTNTTNLNEIIIRQITINDYNSIWNILEPIIKEGETYALPRDWNKEDLLSYWCQEDHIVYIAISTNNNEDNNEDNNNNNNNILGTYFIHSNQKGGGNHICNCGYATLNNSMGKGIGYQMCLHSLNIAKELGYKGMQYNFVISSNERAVKLWKKCGFNIVGELPEAFLSPKYGYVNVYVMFQKLI